MGVRPDTPDYVLRVPLPHDEPFMLINYPGPASSFVTLSLADVVDGTFDPAAVRGKAVLAGVTLVGETNLPALLAADAAARRHVRELFSC